MKRRLALVAALSLVLTWLLGVADVAAKSGGEASGAAAGRRVRTSASFRVRPDDDYIGTPAPEAPGEPKPPKKAEELARACSAACSRAGSSAAFSTGGDFGGVGLLEVVVLSGLIALGFLGAVEVPPRPGGAARARGGLRGRGTGTLADLRERRTLGPGGASERRRSRPSTRPELADAVGEMFLRVQAAWTARDIAQAADVLTVEMREQLDRECARLRASRRINRVERITLGRVAVMEARQDGGWDRVTVQIVADPGGLHDRRGRPQGAGRQSLRPGPVSGAMGAGAPLGAAPVAGQRDSVNLARSRPGDTV